MASFEKDSENDRKYIYEPLNLASKKWLNGGW